jgi:hypothetical protein
MLLDWRVYRAPLQKVLHRRDHSHHLLQLAALVHSRRLVAGQDYEHALVRLADAAHRSPGVGGELLSGLARIAGGFRQHGRLELIEPGEDEDRPADAVLAAGPEDHPPATSSLTFWLAPMITSGVRERTMTVCWITRTRGRRHARIYLRPENSGRSRKAGI